MFTTSLPSATVIAISHSTAMTATAATTTTTSSNYTTSMTKMIHDGGGGDDDILAMFAPAGMARTTFEQAIRALGEYKDKATFPQPHQLPQQHHQHHQQQAPPQPQHQQPYQQPYQPNPPSYQPLLPSPHITAIKRGIHGELHLFGGLTVYPGCDPTVLYQEYLQLNRGQQDAVKRVLRAKDYALILGLPGTGEANLFPSLRTQHNTTHKHNCMQPFQTSIDSIPMSIYSLLILMIT